MIRQGVVVLVLGMIWCGQRARADHFPPEKQARGKPEHVLAGVNVYTGKVAAAVRRFGKPDRVQDGGDSDYPTGSGERTYSWERGGIRIQVATVYRTDAKSHAIIESPPQIVDVWGLSSPNGIATTGAGLRLGQRLDDVIRIYGSRFQKDPNSLTIQWADETTMVLDLDVSGRIKHIHLEASVD